MNIETLQRQINQNREDQEEKKPKSLSQIGDILQNFKRKPQSSEDKATHERAYWVELTRKSLGTHWKTKKEYTFGMVNGLTRGWSIEKIRDRYLFCTKHVRCEFSKAWFGIRKKEKEEAKKMTV